MVNVEWRKWQAAKVFLYRSDGEIDIFTIDALTEWSTDFDSDHGINVELAGFNGHWERNKILAHTWVEWRGTPANGKFNEDQRARGACGVCGLGKDTHAHLRPAATPLRAQQVGGDHYSKHKIQVWDIVEEYGLDFFEGNVLKYLLRQKNDRLTDLKKAAHYLAQAIESQEASIADDPWGDE